MKITFILLASLISITPAFAQEQTDGQLAGSYGYEGSQYHGLSPGMPIRNTEGPASTSTVGISQTPPPLPARPSWDTQPDTGHSANYEQYVQSQPSQVITPEQAQTTPPYNPVSSSATPTYRSTITEIASLLNYEVKPRQQDLATWYLNGAQIDPNTVRDPGAEGFDDAIRRFVADDIVSAWNMTMQDGILRLMMPILLAIATWKGCEFISARLFSSSISGASR